MGLISLVGAGKDFGIRTLFSDLELHVAPKERLGLIGPNGAGKSTLLRVLAGRESLDRGERRCSPRLRVILLDQDPDLPLDGTVLEAVFAGGGERQALLQEQEELSLALAADPGNGALLARLGDCHRRMDGCDAWGLEQDCREVLERLGLGADPALLTRRVGELSGGNRRRVALAAALVAQPEVLLLDEPTNHLDAEGVEWLQSWLDRFSGALVLVTHDRYLLDRVTRRIVAVERGEARPYEGNYGSYLARRAEEEASASASEAKFRGSLRRELAWLRQGPKARSTKQKARLQRIEAMREAPPRQARGQVSLASASRRLGRQVISAENLAVGVAAAGSADGAAEGAAEGAADSPARAPLLEGFSYDFHAEDRVGIIGPNGVGKSTLLDVLAGLRPASGGRLERGSTVKLAYFDQHSQVLLAAKGERKVIDVVQEAASRVMVEGVELSASQLLERFLFPPAQQHQPVARLSGGERRRLHLCRLLIEAPNLLLLDEPTNDLDVATLTVLEEFLEGFRGCVVVVSHDRWFLDRTVDRLFCFRQGRLERFEGNYSAFLERQQALEAATAASRRPAAAGTGTGPPQAAATVTTGSAQPPTAAPRRRSFRENRELEAIERDLPQWEERRRQLEASLAQPGEPGEAGDPGERGGSEAPRGGASYSRLEAITQELADLVEQIASAEERWLELSERPG